MRKDPLGLFADEKTAADAAANTSDDLKPYRIPRAPSPTSIDPGEAALAGVAAGTGALAAKAIPFIGRVLAQPIVGMGSARWTMPGIQDVSSFKEVGEIITEQRPYRRPKAKVLGLLDVKQRPSVLERAAKRPVLRKFEKEIAREGYRAAQKIGELQNVVDSFIDKHNLRQKGVRISMHPGPMAAIGAGGYETATKRVILPRVGKEVALHELAHAADYTGRAGRIRGLGGPILERSVLVALPIALAAGDQIKEMIPGTIDDRAIEFMQDHAPEIMGATLAATQLYPEAKASFNAIRHIRETEGVAAARTATKRLIPLLGTYFFGAIPAVVGMALARKYMRRAREEKADVQEEIAKLEKTSSLLRGVVEGARDIGYVTKQIGQSAVDLFKKPGTMERISRAAKETGQSPEFLWGAMGAAIPATLGALYVYGTPGGKIIRERMDPQTRDTLLGHNKKDILLAARQNDRWRERHPGLYVGLVAAGAALSGGIISRFLHDLHRVL